MKSSVRIFLYDGPATWLEDPDFPGVEAPSITALQRNPEGEARLCQLREAGKIIDYAAAACAGSWQQAANDLLLQADEDFFMFITGSALPQPGCVPALLQAFEQLNVCCAAPLLLSHDKKRVSHGGYVFDSLMRLHVLYEGADSENPLMRKLRHFQFAHPAVFLVKSADFRGIGGFRTDLGQLCFFDFCGRLRAHTGAQIYVIPDGQAVYENRLEALLTSGLWNSLVLRGKLPPGTACPDYMTHVQADGLAYGITGWLEETCENRNIWPEDDAWFALRHRPEPSALLRWLAGLATEEIPASLQIVRDLPALLPSQFRYYENTAEELGSIFAKNAELEKVIADWKKAARSFRYRRLREGMAVLNAAGIYRASLDRCAAVFDAWLELSPPVARIETGPDWPVIAVAMPVYNPHPEYFRQAIESVMKQNYGNWQLCLADDASTSADTRSLLAACSGDRRIRIVYRQENGHISAATNSALKLVDAPWTAFMDQDDLLAENALAMIAAAAHDKPELRLIYSDEDHITATGLRRSPCFRSSSTLHLRGHLMAYSTPLLREIGGVRSGFEGAQDYELNLRVTERTGPDEARHIPQILYHWRIHEGSTAGSVQSKPYVFAAARRALEASILRNGLQGEVLATAPGFPWRPAYRLPPAVPALTVLFRDSIAPSQGLLEKLEHLREKNGIEYIEREESGAEIRAYEDIIRRSRQEVILFVAPELEPLADCRPEQLIAECLNRDFSAVGSLVWNGPLLHDGGIYPDVTRRLFPLLRGAARNELADLCWSEFLLSHQVLAVSRRCFAVRRKDLLDLLPFDDSSGPLAFLDLCLRLAEKRRKMIVSPWGQWRLNREPEDLRPDPEQEEAFRKRWGDFIARNGLRNASLEAAPDNNWTLILPRG